MLIGILQCGHFLDRADADLGDYDDMFKRLLSAQGLTFKTWDVVDMEFPESVDEAQGWLITGSRHGAYDDLEFIPPLEDFICRAYAKGVPMVGICFGHQIIAQALGGRVAKASGGWQVGRKVYNFDGEEVALNAWHQDQVIEAPVRAKTIASSDTCEHAALLYEGKALTIQAHPEFAEPAVSALIAAYRKKDAIKPSDLDAARESTPDPVNNDAMADRMAAFFKDNLANG